MSKSRAYSAYTACIRHRKPHAYVIHPIATQPPNESENGSIGDIFSINANEIFDFDKFTQLSITVAS